MFFHRNFQSFVVCNFLIQAHSEMFYPTNFANEPHWITWTGCNGILSSLSWLQQNWQSKFPTHIYAMPIYNQYKCLNNGSINLCRKWYDEGNAFLMVKNPCYLIFIILHENLSSEHSRGIGKTMLKVNITMNKNTCELAPVWSDWAIYWTLGNFLKP